ncbi:MAG: septum site-determining protein MinC [Lachnospiraceae bacterium]|nr:septum site-determining protein MinC [Lachnospiraceae bacterium]
MKNPVIIKGDKGGIHIIIEPMANIDEVLFQLEYKLKGPHKSFKNSKPINVTFDGKELTDDEKRDILFVLSKVGINVCHNQKRQDKNIDKISNIQPDKDGLFYIGNLRNGQSINAKCSIVIIGNVEKGASVYSQGNIVITGSLDGIAKAGCRGKENAFVYSLISGRNI